MTAANYQACEDRVLAHEGSAYTDGVHPYDPGGPTRWGITLTDARLYWKPKATAEDVAGMPRQIACDIYRSKYWAVIRGDDLPSGVDDAVFDYGVNSGVSRAGKVLRRVLGLSDADWHVTDEVLKALAIRPPKAVIHAICAERMKFLQGLKIWPTYGRGWTTRVAEVEIYSMQLASSPGVKPIMTINPLLTARGSQAPSNAAMGAVALIGGGSAAGAAGGFQNWISSHQLETVAIAGVGLIIIGGILYLVNRNHALRQDAPTAGLIPVPVK